MEDRTIRILKRQIEFHRSTFIPMMTKLLDNPKYSGRAQHWIKVSQRAIIEDSARLKSLGG